MTDQKTFLHDLSRVGAFQFGQFEVRGAPGLFQPLALNLRLLPSYPALLAALAESLVPLVRIDGLTHLLTTPATTPIGVAVSLASGLPLVYPAPDDAHHVEGAYDYDEPTVLLTDVLSDGAAERALIQRVHGLGLSVRAVVAVLDLGIHPGATGGLPLAAWGRLPVLLDLLGEAGELSPAMNAAVQTWLWGEAQRQNQDDPHRNR